MKKFIQKYKDILIVLLLLIVIDFGGMTVGGIVSVLISPFVNETSIIYTIMDDYLFYTLPQIIIIFIIFYNTKDKPLLKKFNLKENKLVLGLLLGFVMNMFCILVATINKDITFELSKVNIFIMILAFLCVMVQSASEEIMCRFFIYEKVKQNHKVLTAILINSIVFTVWHLGNDGISVIAVMDLFFDAILMSLLVYCYDNMWIVIGQHTAWNFTQNFLFGLPNSGYPSPYSLLKLTSSKSSIVYDNVFGVEGTIVSVLMTILFIIIVVLRNKEKTKKIFTS